MPRMYNLNPQAYSSVQSPAEASSVRQMPGSNERATDQQAIRLATMIKAQDKRIELRLKSSIV